MSNVTATLKSADPAAASSNGDGIAHQLDYENQYVSFWVDGQLLGVPVNAVQEVSNPQSIAPTPKARTEIAGLLNLRGQIVTAVNLRKRMGLPDLDEDQDSMNVVVRHEEESYSLLVDEVGEVINVSTETLEPVPHTLDSHWKAVTCGVFRLEDRLFVILNVNAILTFN
jgi:purine-binding chemotaxis protein CheW